MTPDEGARSALADAAFITADAQRGEVLRFATVVTLDRPAAEVVSAVIHATAHGVYELTVDGRPVTRDVLNPGWTAYEWRLQVQRFDVTALLADGDAHVLEARVGNGWYRGDYGFEGLSANYGEEIGLLAALEITYANGTRQRLTTGPGWAADTCEITANSFYNGQSVDARIGGGRALPVRISDLDRCTLVAQAAPAIRRHEVLSPRRIWTSPSGRTLVDFGQNLVGWIRLRVRGEEGAVVTVSHAEVLERGELGTRPLRGAAATDRYTLSGGDDVFEPTFTFHGFRYAQVDGLPVGFDPGDLEAVVIHSGMTPTMSFECSDPLVNRLVSNVVWGQKGNFLSVPTDCPQRDERLGWTGDIAVFAETAAAQFDVADFLHSWLLDLAAETVHHDPPAVPVVVPDVLKYGHYAADAMFRDVHSQAVWGDAAVWVPKALWEAYGDWGRLGDHYPGMVAYLESIEPLLSPSGLWDTGMQLADWLDPDAPPDQPWAAKADPGVVATAAFHRSAAFVAEAADILGREADAARWTALAGRLRRAFNDAYVGGGRIASDCATVYAIAICFGLLDDADCVWAADRLAELVRERGHVVTTGFAGTPYVTWALSEHGHVDDAYRLLLQTGCPSWLYPVKMGATTIWERWDSMLPDGSINPGDMTSFNHYALGAVAGWLYGAVAGIRPARPGFAEVLIQPRPGPGLDRVRATRRTPAGPVTVAWSTAGETFDLDVALPDGVPATLALPDGSRRRVIGGSHRLSCALEGPSGPYDAASWTSMQTLSS
ncbi:alpha-L-rhamnosidase [Tessaracoccus palaemonis]|uniref:Glycoside hydrolase family 78 protein n=1 Tax=Tessaracoccus palaemonis TaxID=2829499 RepID=A0ABX8SNT4_9ACTN|nr:alpha-L-rhamnosidase [Tessaracoccus palaemonis]QXT63733.1 glycoside hydrolase family 78 protein [Tessaracoccus palaemonis]